MRFNPAICVLLLAGAACGQSAPAAERRATQEAAQERATQDDTPRLLLDSQLNAQAVRLVSISETSVVVRPEGGRSYAIPRRDVLAILPPLVGGHEPSAVRAGARLDLADGQTLPGAPLGASAPDRLAWESRLLGPIDIALESAAFVLLRPEVRGADRRRAASGDTVFLANGDSAEGFVSALGLDVTLERDRTPTVFPPGRVASVTFANPPLPAAGTWAWFFDGSAVALAGFELDADGKLQALTALPGATDAKTLVREARELRALVFDAARLRPLAGLTMMVNAEPADGRRWSPPPVVGETRAAPLFATDIELPGPMSVVWDLPAGAARFAAAVELPPSCRVWGDCTVVVAADATELIRTRLHADSHRTDINVALPAGARRLRIEIEPGPSGPIQDRVVLLRPMVLVGE